MCSYLEWQLNIELSVLMEFKRLVRRDFTGTAAPDPASCIDAAYLMHSPAAQDEEDGGPGEIYGGGEHIRQWTQTHYHRTLNSGRGQVECLSSSLQH